MIILTLNWCGELTWTLFNHNTKSHLDYVITMGIIKLIANFLK